MPTLKITRSMQIIAYTYTDPLIESPPELEIWGWEIDRVYQDLGQRTELDRLLQDIREQKSDYLLVGRFGTGCPASFGKITGSEYRVNYHRN
jgi:hypothetical protein